MTPKGLSTKQARQLIEEYGENELRGKKEKSPFFVFILQFKDVMILILAAAALFSVIIGETTEAVTIIAVMVVNAFMGFIQELRTERTIKALSKLTAPVARAVRDGETVSIKASQLVPGDLIVLRAGDRVPADAETVEATGLNADESILSGESLPLEKSAGSKLYMGTTIAAGHGLAIVKSTGMSTEMGAIAEMLGDEGGNETPLQKRLKALGKVVAASCLAVCAAVAAIGLMRGEAPMDMLLTALSLSVAAIPEGLPAIVTVVLALSVNRMLQKGAVIRKLHAVETLGCATVICSDKTGTITQNRMSVEEAFVGGSALVRTDKKGFGGDVKSLKAALQCAVLCSEGDGEISRGRATGYAAPTEKALFEAAAGFGITKKQLLSECELLSENPFDSARKMMSVHIRKDGQTLLLAKGAPEALLSRCSHSALSGQKRPMSDAERRQALGETARMANAAKRVVAVAVKRGDAAEEGLTLLALLGLSDPPRPEVRDAVRRCKRAGIRPVMITGDHGMTASAIGRAVGFASEGERVIEGTQIEKMSDSELKDVCTSASMFARVTPRHKLRIVKAFRELGHVVAMTGDGVNDAPAIKQADIGVSMGIAGSDVTKEASSVVVLDDNFATIVSAVEEGRIIYGNIRRFIRFMLASNLGEVLTVLLGMLLGLPVVFLPIQILLINLVTDSLPAVALGMEGASDGIMERPPRPPSEGLFAGGMLGSIVFRGSLHGLCNTLCFIISLILSGGDVTVARSAAFLTLVFAQLVFVAQCRFDEGERFTFKKLFSNSTMIFAFACSASLSLAAVYLPAFRPVFQTAAVPAELLPAVAATALACPLLGAFDKIKA